MDQANLDRRWTAEGSPGPGGILDPAFRAVADLVLADGDRSRVAIQCGPTSDIAQATAQARIEPPCLAARAFAARRRAASAFRFPPVPGGAHDPTKRMDP